MSSGFLPRWAPIWRLREALFQTRPELDELALAKLALENGWACRDQKSRTKRLNQSTFDKAVRSLKVTEKYLKIKHKNRIIKCDSSTVFETKNNLILNFDSTITRQEFNSSGKYVETSGMFFVRKIEHFEPYYFYPKIRWLDKEVLHIYSGYGFDFIELAIHEIDLATVNITLPHIEKYTTMYHRRGDLNKHIFHAKAIPWNYSDRWFSTRDLAEIKLTGMPSSERSLREWMASQLLKNPIGILPPDEFCKSWTVHFNRLPARARSEFSMRRINYHHYYFTGVNNDAEKGWEYMTAQRLSASERDKHRREVMWALRALIKSGQTILSASFELENRLQQADDTDRLKIASINANQRAVVPSAFTLRYWWKQERSNLKS